jgi:hypothetical protein
MHLVDGTLGASGPDELALARDPASARGAIVPEEQARGTISFSAGPAPREAFATLDSEPAAGTAAGPATWTQAGSRNAEAGFYDPALGWVGVRADLSGGGMHAALVPASADASEVLGGHLAGLNAYLGEHRSVIETVTLAAPESRPAENRMDQGGNQSLQHGAGQDTGQDTPSNPIAPQRSSGKIAVRSMDGRATPSSQLDATAGAWQGDGHISVMA